MAIPKLPPVLQDVLNPPMPAQPPTPTAPPVTPGAAGTFGGVMSDTGELPWVTQQRNMLLGFADRDNWPDWIRASYGLPPRDPNAAASPYIEQITNQQRRAQQIAAQGARLRAKRAAAAPVGGTPAFLNQVLPPAAAAGGFAAPGGVANPYPMLTELANGGNLGASQATGGALGAGGAATVPSIGTVAPVPPRQNLFS